MIQCRQPDRVSQCQSGIDQRTPRRNGVSEIPIISESQQYKQYETPFPVGKPIAYRSTGPRCSGTRRYRRVPQRLQIPQARRVPVRWSSSVHGAGVGASAPGAGRLPNTGSSAQATQMTAGSMAQYRPHIPGPSISLTASETAPKHRKLPCQQGCPGESRHPGCACI